VLSNKFERIGLTGDGIQKLFRRHRICLASFYPDKIPNDINSHDVDHIDGNHENNVLSNLQWLKRSEHTRKTMTQTKQKRKSYVEKAGRKVKVMRVEKGGETKYLNKIFNSCTCAANELRVDSGSISQSAKKGYVVDEKYVFGYVDEMHIQGEIFKPLGDYEVSNKGRVKMKRGNITTGTNITFSRYRKIGIKLQEDTRRKQYLVHVLVWIAFNGPIPEGKVIMHDDTKRTRDHDGYERNWLEDLKLGTHSENAQSYHNNRSNRKRILCVDTNKEYRSVTDCGRDLGIDLSSIIRVCNKKQRTTKGYKFEYV
jgi:hypothetical protein